MKVVVVSLMHTGTVFTKTLLNTNHAVHIHAISREPGWNAKDALYVIPLRNPVMIFRSWQNRRPPREIQNISAHMASLVNFWYRYQERTILFPVDKETYRDRQLARILDAADLEIEGEVDWTPDRVFGSEPEWRDGHSTVLQLFLEAGLPLFKQYY